MKLAFSTLILSATLLCGVTQAFYSASDDVVELTASNFHRLVIKDDAIWVVEFFAPWCGACQSLVPEYKKLATALKGVIKVGSVDADAQKALGFQYGIRMFPTIKIFGTNKRSPSDYNGQRTAMAIAEAALAEAKKKVQETLGGGGGGDSSSGGAGDVIKLTVELACRANFFIFKDMYMVLVLLKRNLNK